MQKRVFLEYVRNGEAKRIEQQVQATTVGEVGAALRILANTLTFRLKLPSDTKVTALGIDEESNCVLSILD